MMAYSVKPEGGQHYGKMIPMSFSQKYPLCKEGWTVHEAQTCKIGNMNFKIILKVYRKERMIN